MTFESPDLRPARDGTLEQLRRLCDDVFPDGPPWAVEVPRGTVTGTFPGEGQ